MTIKVELTFATAQEAAKALANMAGGAATTSAAVTVAPTVEADVKPAPVKAKAVKAKAPEPAPVAEEDEEEVAAPAPAPVKAKVEKLTFQDIRDVISKHTEVHGLEASKAILADLGFVKASAIPDTKYAEVMSKFEAALDA